MERNWLKECTYEEMEDKAMVLAKRVGSASNQAVRTIFTTILEMERQPEKLPLAIHKLYYHAERNKEVKPLVREIEPLLRGKKERGEMEKLEEFVEAIVAYHLSQPWKEEGKRGG